MHRFIEAIVEALVAEAGAGELLAEVGTSRIYNEEATKGSALPLIIVWPFDKRKEAGHTDGYRLYVMEAEVNVYSAYSEFDKWTKKNACMTLGEKAERVLLNNPRLITSTYAEGVIVKREQIDVTVMEPFTAVIPGTATEAYLCKLTVSGRVILRDGSVSVS